MAKITIVDDSKLVRDLIRRSLGDLDHEVQVVDPQSLFDVLKAVREFMPALVITDYHMPNCSSESLVRALREDPHLKALKILVLSAHHDDEAVKRMMQRGIDGFLFKGNTPMLVERVRALVG
jgi:two-component system phosphate regulon response regulator PhoB